MAETKTPRPFSEMCSDFFGMTYISGRLFDTKWLFLTRWRVALMEESIARLDFLELDDMVQVHGEQDMSPYAKWPLSIQIIHIIDYDGVSLRNRDANSKNAASEASSIFQGHYPEFLVSACPLPSPYH
jgi:hypothetical protein